MRLLLAAACFCFFLNYAHAQLNVAAYKDGKYHEIKNKSNLTGPWIDKDSGLKLNITIVKRNINRGEFNFSTDFLIVKIQRLIYNNRNVAGEFSSPVELFSLGNDGNYSGLFKDPVTSNSVSVTLNYVNRNTIRLTTRMPEMSIENDPKKGTVFPAHTVILTR